MISKPFPVPSKGERPLHFVGIGGVGMSAIAQVMLEAGYAVSGSDLKLSPLTIRLQEKGAIVHQGHSLTYLGNAQMVVVSAAVPQTNPEVEEARRQGIPVVKRAQILGWLMSQKQGIAIAGTHGKTTTTALIAFILERSGMEPTILVGGEMVDLATNAKLGQGPYLVAEADEFDGAFLHLAPYMAVVTNIEPEHLDYYGSYHALVDAFRLFIDSAAGPIIACADDPQIQALKSQVSNLTTYGLGEAQWQATHVRADGSGQNFTVTHEGQTVGDFTINLPGRHNVANALAAIAAGSALNIPFDQIRATLACFHGTRRRFEIRGEVRGITLVDDYAHHPTEIKATLEAARQRFGRRSLVCVFQPHTYSRTKLLLHQFATAFTEADSVIIANIYPAREEDTWGISAADLAAALSHPNAHYAGDLHHVVERLLGSLKDGDVLLVLGAGDVDKVTKEVWENLKETS